VGELKRLEKLVVVAAKADGYELHKLIIPPASYQCREETYKAFLEWLQKLPVQYLRSNWLRMWLDAVDKEMTKYNVMSKAGPPLALSAKEEKACSPNLYFAHACVAKIAGHKQSCGLVTVPASIIKSALLPASLTKALRGHILPKFEESVEVKESGDEVYYAFSKSLTEKYQTASPTVMGAVKSCNRQP